ncbi:MAG: DUF2867 domain-containing protein [Chitinophagaceae bacterium]|nr:DUF2867 domain-containing protein [Chitinophagaceae bacterium]
MKIIKSTLPDKSLLNQTYKKYDYVDSFQGLIIDKENKLRSTDIGKAFFSSAPKWIDTLMNLRNKTVSVFGLKTPGNIVDRQMILKNFRCEKGEQVGLFRIFDKTENEIILGEDDKHLDFRVSLYLDKPNIEQVEKRLTISTSVNFNNWFGRLYFLPIRPFHSLIVPTMLKTIIKQLKKQSL